ncbi:aspartate kinase [Zunongwangia endophytica]|uniref:Aspartokinase n=1 Tax=Zunongwangia endophytica TaxID=1808945 RepID=A0ABV8HF56_9FLAO|nr:aspartate kinase [Zunongwangia endophytica]MDN3594116.1 aspartate kinase [Zunongwangia endophytica]
MKVLKFGGTSVGTPESIQNVKNITLGEEGRKMLVLSAMSGVTNDLVAISNLVQANKFEEVYDIVDKLKDRHFSAIDQLINDESLKKETKTFVSGRLQDLLLSANKEYTEVVYAEIVTYGEAMLTFIVSQYFKSLGIDNIWLDAKKFMEVHNLENPDTDKVGKLLDEYISNQTSDLYITQGFVCINKRNEISTLKRGGSDYTATILGAAVQATEVQIWTDIDGFHNNDPRHVEGTHPISELTFEEAAELAYFGAKILHPQTVSPVINKGIPIFLKNTFTPEKTGTRISSEITSKGLKAIAAKDDITAIKIKSNRMLMAHGFLRKIFDVFDNYETSIDMITTSEIAISLTIDNTRNLDQILEELNAYGEITVDRSQSIICIVGESVIEDKSTYKLFELLNDIPVRMISYGGSSNNISILVDTQNKIDTLRSLNHKLFSEGYATQMV